MSGACFTTCTGPGKRTSIPIRTWSPGSVIRPSWSRNAAADGTRDFRRLAGLLDQPLAALNGDNYAKPVWHCALRAAPEDRMLSDAEWARVAAHVMDRTGLAPSRRRPGGAVGRGPARRRITSTWSRRWPARTGTGRDLWNDFYRKLRTRCRDAEEWFGLRSTAPADRTAARRADPGRVGAGGPARVG